MRVTYSSNNSGGSWWLTDDDWRNLEAAGWDVQWKKDGERFLGALAMKASKDFGDPADAIAEFERITGQDASAEGCNCCGSPHSFEYTDDAGEYHYTSVEVKATALEWN